MKLQRFSAYGAAMVLALVSLLTFGFDAKAQAAGTTLYWCEFSSNSNFNTASNWNTSDTCSGGTQEVPVSGDALVFDNSHLTSTLDITNNISGLDLSSITLQGNGSGSYDLTGDAISLDAGLSDSGSGSRINYIDLDITLTTSQSFDVSGNDSLEFLADLNLGSYNLSLSPGITSIDGTISGSGSLTFNSPSSGVASYTLSGAGSGFSGPVTIDQNAAVVDQSGSINALGSGSISIAGGGSLTLDDSASSATLPNNLYLSGDGDGSQNFGVIVSCLGLNGTCSTASTDLTLSGNVTLDGNAEVVNGAYTSGESSPPTNSSEFDFTGDLTYNGHSLTAVPASNTIVDLPPLPSTSSSSSQKAPGAPDTGYGQTIASSYLPLIGTALIVLALALATATLRKTPKKRL